jgi:asparagine synthase (glutamine-hydrolysing)
MVDPINLGISRLRRWRRLLALRVTEPQCFRAIKRVRQEKLTYLQVSALADLCECVGQLERDGRDGIMIEAGCALGGSAVVIAAAKNPSRPLYVYDLFGMIPPPSERDGQDAHDRYAEIVDHQSDGIKGDEYYGYQQDLFERVKATFPRLGYPIEKHNIHLVQGLFEDTLVVTQAVALAHLDCDWYDSVLACLQRIEPRLVQGGTLIIDDYDDWSGCRAAVDDYFAGRQGEFDFVRRSRLHIIRK